MKLEQIHEAFEEVVKEPGIYNRIQVPKNNVAQYRWKIKRGIHISIDKKISILQRAGYRMEQFEFTDKDMIDIIRFVMRASKNTKAMGPEYLFEKWKAKAAAVRRRSH